MNELDIISYVSRVIVKERPLMKAWLKIKNLNYWKR